MANPVPKSDENDKSTVIYVLSPAGSIPKDWDTEAKAAGIKPSRIATLGSIKTKLTLHPNPVLVIRYGNDQELGLQLLKKMLKSPDLHGLTLVVVGEEAEELEQELGRVQRIVLSRNEPCNAKAFLETLQRAIQLNGPSHTAASLAAGEPPRGVTELNTPEIELPKSDFTEKLFDYLSREKLREKVIGGHHYVGNGNSKQLLDELMQSHAWAKEILVSVIDNKDSWLKNHVARAAYMTDRILGALNVTDEQRRLGRASAILRAEAFKDKPRLLRTDYNRDKAGNVRREIHDALLESARTLVDRSVDAKIGEIINLAAKMISGEVATLEGEDAITASSIVAMDAVERTCWSMGYFNTLRAYLLLRSWRQGGAPSLHFGVICCTAKFISEGVVSVPFRHTLAKGARVIPTKIFDSIDGLPSPAELGRIVSIDSLTPGMKLISPLVTFDGRELIGSDVQLDEDLIWRIWQLASIRPIRSACVEL